MENQIDSVKRVKVARPQSPTHANEPLDLSQYRVNLNKFNVASKHPLGVLPKGNYLMSISGSKESIQRFKEKKKKAMGYFNDWDFEQFTDLVKNYIDDPQTLKNLQACSRVFYGILHEEDIWRNLYMKEYEILELQTKTGTNSVLNIIPFKELGASKKWLGSWRRTLLNIPGPEYEALIQSDNLIFSDHLFRPFQNKNINYKKVFKKIIDLEKLNYENCHNSNLLFSIERFSKNQFYENKVFESKYFDRPFILQDTLDTSSFKLDKIDSLLEILSPDSQFRQETVKWTLKQYIDYFYNNKDESPLYLFDCNKDLLSKLNVCFQKPRYADLDFFDLFKETRPDNLWIISGPGNSGSTFHKDPNSTSAWNQLLSGMKLWIMLPPDISPPGVIADAEEENVTAPLSLSEWVNSGFFNDCIKLCQQNTSEKKYCLIGCTFPGETIYVPSNWWHSVINLEDSIAMTGNFVPKENLFKVISFFKNKKLQISGFHLKMLIESMKKFYEHNRVKFSDLIEPAIEQAHIKLATFLNSSETAVLLNNLDDEDCGVMGDNDNNILNEIPIYEFFIMLIYADNDYAPHLAASLIKQREYELACGKNKPTKVKDSKLWSNLTTAKTSEKAATPFAFNLLDESSSEED
ncbi:hypothetical protein QEN19_003345 [Hanseniaspora menglaensis]